MKGYIMRLLFFKDDKPFKATFTMGELKNVKNVHVELDMSKYITLKQYLLKMNGKNRKIKSLQDSVDSDKIYVKLEEDEELALEDFWWLDFYKKCKKCEKICKQSHKITGLTCKEYKEK